uniref:Uncharacterized protein n=1 Tax=Ditylenchus dipsaci TaxID=166011 RepID=A0A915EF89_9BILA
MQFVFLFLILLAIMPIASSFLFPGLGSGCCSNYAPPPPPPPVSPCCDPCGTCAGGGSYGGGYNSGGYNSGGYNSGGYAGGPNMFGRKRK